MKREANAVGSRRSMSYRVLVTICLLMILPVNVMAHSLYIQACRYQVDEGKRSPLFFCYGHRIPVDDGVRGKKLKAVKVHPPRGPVREIAVRDETSLHSYMVDYDVPGTYALTAETNPGYYTVYIDKKGKKRHTIKPKSAILDRAQKVQKSLYSKQYTKTYVVCEEPSKTFPKHVGLALELVPDRDIAALKAGEELSLSVYLNGKPYEGEGTWDATYSGFSTESEDYLFPKTAVSGGKFKVPVSNTGRWFVRYFIKIDATGDDAKIYDEMKLTATLVFQIPNERLRAKAAH